MVQSVWKILSGFKLGRGIGKNAPPVLKKDNTKKISMQNFRGKSTTQRAQIQKNLYPAYFFTAIQRYKVMIYSAPTHYPKMIMIIITYFSM